MKSKTSCYEPALARMGLRRFAPAMAGYAIATLLLTLNLLGDCTEAAQYVHVVRDTLDIHCMVNFLYAAVLAQLFFGDLYNTRLGYGLRSLPMTRGSWYGTQIILGLFASILPNLLNAGLMLLYVREYQIIVLWWLIASQLQFLCFYGLAMLCSVCAGNRIGMVILYTIVNFTNIFINWIITRTYVPLVYGLTPQRIVRAPLSPMATLNNTEFFMADYSYIYQPASDVDYDIVAEVVDRVYLTEQVWAYVIWAAVGILAMWLGLRLLRRVKAEYAGELLTFPKLEPAILLLVTLGMGVAFHIASSIFGWQMTYILLTVGMVIGYYGCLMLLKRRTSVFSAKSLTPLAGILAGVYLSLALTGLDVLHIGQRIPDADEVASASLNSYYDGAKDWTDPEDVETIIGIHTQLLQEGQEAINQQGLLRRIFSDKDYELNRMRDYGAGDLTIEYTLKNGSTLRRQYQITKDSQAVDAVARILSSPELVIARTTSPQHGLVDADGSLSPLLERMQMVQLDCGCGVTNEFSHILSVNISDPEEWPGLLDAILADCRNGTMAQEWYLHGADYYNTDTLALHYLYPDAITGKKLTYSIYLTIYPDCTNTIQWLTENGYHAEAFG